MGGREVGKYDGFIMDCSSAMVLPFTIFPLCLRIDFEDWYNVRGIWRNHRHMFCEFKMKIGMKPHK